MMVEKRVSQLCLALIGVSRNPYAKMNHASMPQEWPPQSMGFKKVHKQILAQNTHRPQALHSLTLSKKTKIDLA